MNLKKLLFTLFVLSVSFLNACENTEEESTQKSFSTMSTQELQVEVEKLSQVGKLPFEMGLELMKRWQNV
jgi:hypothetical protein